MRRSLVLCMVVVAVPALFAQSTGQDFEGQLVELYSKNKFFNKTDYKALRAAFADRFERKYAKEIEAAFGEDHAALTKWLNDNADIKEDFYTAIDEKHDHIPQALAIFKNLYKKHPDKLKAYGQLAIAISVTWDDAKAVYDYGGHQVRTKSKLPDDVKKIGPMENFDYFLDNEAMMQGRGTLLPWEFLVHSVNHRTPLSERQWSQQNYLVHRPMIGQCYKDIAYDNEMLSTEKNGGKGPGPHLAGFDYTLPSILKHGGVCAMQADFAARVGKSLGVPAEYVGGEGNSGGRHAWVMWAEIKQVQKDQIAFTLESYGRYLGDQYYVGDLRDPHTGQKITDRDMELRLALTGYDRVGKRHSALLMEAFPIIREKQTLSTNGQLAYLDKVIGVCKYNEEAWLAIAKLCKDGEVKAADWPGVHSRILKMFDTYAKFPDFSWKVFDDMMAMQKDSGVRASLYEKLVQGYENIGRPDLACEARLKLADYQLESKKHRTAAEGIAQTVRKFPSEGRYIPKMVAKLQEICGQFKGGNDLLMDFYVSFLPKVPAKRGSDVSSYCLKMYEQGIAYFKDNLKDKPNKTRETQLDAMRQELELVKAGKRK